MSLPGIFIPDDNEPQQAVDVALGDCWVSLASLFVRARECLGQRLLGAVDFGFLFVCLAGIGFVTATRQPGIECSPISCGLIACYCASACIAACSRVSPIALWNLSCIISTSSTYTFCSVTVWLVFINKAPCFGPLLFAPFAAVLACCSLRVLLALLSALCDLALLNFGEQFEAQLRRNAGIAEQDGNGNGNGNGNGAIGGLSERDIAKLDEFELQSPLVSLMEEEERRQQRIEQHGEAVREREQREQQQPLRLEYGSAGTTALASGPSALPSSPLPLTVGAGAGAGTAGSPSVLSPFADGSSPRTDSPVSLLRGLGHSHHAQPHAHTPVEFVCGICLEAFRRGETLKTLPACSHKFHVKCIATWLRKKGTCPMCRQRVVAGQSAAAAPPAAAGAVAAASAVSPAVSPAAPAPRSLTTASAGQGSGARVAASAGSTATAAAEYAPALASFVPPLSLSLALREEDPASDADSESDLPVETAGDPAAAAAPASVATASRSRGAGAGAQQR